VPTYKRYLVLDSVASCLADASWVNLRKSVTICEAGYEAEPEEEPKPDGLPRMYFYNARRVRESQVDFELVKSWIMHCENTHSRGSRIANSASSLPPRFRVIDVVKRAVVPASQSCRYVALSYVWGKGGSAELPNYSLTCSRLPRTVEDAITVVKELGERYLWVDAYW
jgi:hypothetical protein